MDPRQEDEEGEEDDGRDEAEAEGPADRVQGQPRDGGTECEGEEEGEEPPLAAAGGGFRCADRLEGALVVFGEAPVGGFPREGEDNARNDEQRRAQREGCLFQGGREQEVAHAAAVFAAEDAQRFDPLVAGQAHGQQRQGDERPEVDVGDPEGQQEEDDRRDDRRGVSRGDGEGIGRRSGDVDSFRFHGGCVCVWGANKYSEKIGFFRAAGPGWRGRQNEKKPRPSGVWAFDFN